jgi:hypothetical protein
LRLRDRQRIEIERRLTLEDRFAAGGIDDDQPFRPRRVGRGKVGATQPPMEWPTSTAFSLPASLGNTSS